jgi:hypothetical protein
LSQNSQGWNVLGKHHTRDESPHLKRDAKFRDSTYGFHESDQNVEVAIQYLSPTSELRKSRYS